MIGRAAELATLLAAEQRAATGAGGAIELVGPPGIGKSRLLAEVEARCTGDVLWAQGDIYAGARPYAPFERLLRTRWEIAENAGSEVLAARLEAVTRKSAPHLLPWLPLIAIVAGLHLPTTAQVDQTDATVRKQRLEELTSELLGVVLNGPSVLIFDDAHLMDDASLDLIGKLAADAQQRPWLVIVSRRLQGRSPLAEAQPRRSSWGR